MDYPTFTGEVEHIQRVRSGLYSLDVAFGDKNGTSLGIPVKVITEIYGHTHVGKSSLAYYLAGVMSKSAGKSAIIDLCDFEGLDPSYVISDVIQSGFTGQIKLVSSHKVKTAAPRPHTEMLDEVIADYAAEPNLTAVVLDSVGAFMSDAERTNTIGEANMGKRAFSMNQFIRKTSDWMRSRQPFNLFAVNHVHTTLNGMQGHITPGGELLKQLAVTRIMLWTSKTIKVGDDIVAYEVQGKTEKHRYGGKGRTFQFVLIPEVGVHPGMTAMLDCVSLKLAERGATVKIGDKSIGRISKLLDAANSGNTEIFQPFFEVLNDYTSGSARPIIPMELGEDLDQSEELVAPGDGD